MLKEAKQKMGPDKLILFNPLHGHDPKRGTLGEEYLPVTDGAMVDDFDRAANIRQQSKEYLANTIEVMRKAARDGKIIIFKAWPGFTWWSDKEMMKKPHDEVHRVASERHHLPAGLLPGGGRTELLFLLYLGLAWRIRDIRPVSGVRQAAGTPEGRGCPKRLDLPARIRPRLGLRGPGKEVGHHTLEIDFRCSRR